MIIRRDLWYQRMFKKSSWQVRSCQAQRAADTSFHNALRTTEPNTVERFYKEYPCHDHDPRSWGSDKREKTDRQTHKRKKLLPLLFKIIIYNFFWTQDVYYHAAEDWNERRAWKNSEQACHSYKKEIYILFIAVLMEVESMPKVMDSVPDLVHSALYSCLSFLVSLEVRNLE